MHEPLLAQAALPAPEIILGMLMRPYSLGHELFLIRERNPVVVGGKVLPKDIREAVLICSQTFEEARGMSSDWLISFKLWLWNRRTKKANHDLATAAFHQYRAAGLLEFPISDVLKPSSDPTPRTPGTPFILRLHHFVMRHLGKSESEAWDYPYGLAKMRWACHWEQEGGLEVYNENDANFDKFVAEQEAKAAAKGAK